MKTLRVLCLSVLLLFLAACADSAITWQQQYDLGVRCLSEGDYEKAITAFTAAIELDAAQGAAYEGRADAYVGAAEADGGAVDRLLLAKQDYRRTYDLAAADSVTPKLRSLFETIIDFYYEQDDIETAKSYFEEMASWMGGEAVPDKWGLGSKDVSDDPEKSAGATLGANEFLAALDGNSWHFFDRVSETDFVFGFTFDGNGAGSYYYGYPFSDILSEGTTEYSVEGDRLTLALSEGVGAVYHLAFTEDNILLTQASSQGIGAHHVEGYELIFVGGLYADWSEMS